MQKSVDWKQVLHLSVIVAALGYFVDMYDLVLFTIVRVASLNSLGVTGAEVTRQGVLLINMQMIGMLLGGILWGVLGDRHGRRSVLFGSILLYSLANLANGTVTSVPAYAAWRFLAGLGLAGELGAGVSLVSEILSTQQRGYGTMLVTGFGTCGALAAGTLGQVFYWRNCYYLGGVLGLGLLLLRLGVRESDMFSEARQTSAPRGHFFALFRHRAILIRYLKSIFIAVPIWYVIGILVTFCPELGTALGVRGHITSAVAIIWFYTGTPLGAFTSGWLSQAWASRRRVIGVFLIGTTGTVLLFFLLRDETPMVFYSLLGAGGFFTGYWAVFVAAAAEQFGTNIRATVATTAPNFVRGSVVLMTSTLQALKPAWGLLPASACIGALALAVALWAWLGGDETHGKNLDYLEDFT